MHLTQPSYLFLLAMMAVAIVLSPLGQPVATAGNAVQSAEQMEESLHAVEWYTEEYFRKALKAEQEGDAAAATEYGKRAIVSDRNADSLRTQAAAAWLARQEPDHARQLWADAARQSRQRAELLGARLPSLQRQVQLAWKQYAGKDESARGKGPAHADWLQARSVYLEGVYYAAQQWVRAAEFAEKAGVSSEADYPRQRALALLPELTRLTEDELRILAPNIAVFVAEVRRWHPKAAG